MVDFLKILWKRNGNMHKIMNIGVSSNNNKARSQRVVASKEMMMKVFDLMAVLGYANIL